MAARAKDENQDAGASTARHPVDEVLPLGRMAFYGFQHVLAMYAAVVAVPLIIGGALGMEGADLTYLVSACLFVSGLATLLQSLGLWRFGARLPMVQGSSFIPVSAMIAMGTAAGGGAAGIQVISGSVIVAGLVCVALTPLFARMLRFFPRVVTGSVVTVMGLVLVPVAISWAAGGDGAEDFGSPTNILVATLTTLVIVLIYRFLPAAVARMAIILGLVIGTFIAVPFGMVDLSHLSDTPWFQFSTPFHFGAPVFEVGAILTMVVVFTVIMVETVADTLAIGEIVGRPADRRAVAGAVSADMLSSAVSGVFNGFPLSAFAQNVGMIAVTGIRSRFVVACGGVILVVLGLVPALGAIVAIVPSPVLGGAGIVLFGTVAASGIRTLSSVDYEGNNNLLIVALAIGVGLIPVVVPEFWSQFPAWFSTIANSGITATALIAVVLNALFNIWGAKDGSGGRDAMSEGPPMAAISAEGEERLTGQSTGTEDNRGTAERDGARSSGDTSA